ncbi:MAG: FHA domain-containing protein [Planctomycetota bacterium]|jgi:pSer/pThr/pTyr-binding forkhead associated (FHA) protein
MRLTVKQSDRVVNEFTFARGPIHIGRRANAQIFLPDRAVSKQHAVIFNTDDGIWMVEDLKSANKTYLNESPVDKAEIKTGDIIQITDFTIEINVEEEKKEEEKVQPGDTIQLEATLATPPHDIVVRKPDAGHAPAMRLAAKRLTDFSVATESLGEAKSLDELLVSLLEMVSKQFEAYHVWCALREQPNGPMMYYAGKRRDGKPVNLEDIALQDKINQVVEKGQSLVLPRVNAQLEGKERIRSAMVAAILRHNGCYGVIYVDNAMVHDHYALSDLDYLMLLAIYVASVLKRLTSS